MRPTTMKDKGLIHSMLLGLSIRNYKLDLESFGSLFQLKSLGVKKLLDLSRYIYAVPSKEDKKIIMLKLPLPEEMPKATGKKKKSTMR